MGFGVSTRSRGRARGSRLAVPAGFLILAACAIPTRPDGGKARSTAAPHDPPSGAEAVSLLGKPLFAPPLTPEQSSEREARLREAREAVERDPTDADAILWLGRRTAYLGRFREAIEIFGRGIEAHPSDARFYRHRGHRFLTVRRLDLAIADLENAADLIEGIPDQVEPDGLPNARNVPTSTLHSNVWYHLGLARYLTGDLEGASRCFRQCLRWSRNPDMLCATSYWLYITLRASGRDVEAEAVLAPIHEEMDIIENRDYHRLLLMFQGRVSPEALLGEAGTDEGSVAFATVGYGVGWWFRMRGWREEGSEVFRRILAAGQWPAFGSIAAEADLARWSRLRPRSRSR